MCRTAELVNIHALLYSNLKERHYFYNVLFATKHLILTSINTKLVPCNRQNKGEKTLQYTLKDPL